MTTKFEGRPSVYLDTSIQIRRILASAEKRNTVEQIIAEDIIAYTSQYVYMEFQRTVIADFAHVHKTLCTRQDWGDALTELASGSRTFRPRSLARSTRILGETLKRSHLNLQKGLLHLETYLDYRLTQKFWNHVSPLPDSITCDLTVKGITPLPDRSYDVASRCRKESASCFLPQFLEIHRPKLQKIALFLADNPSMIKSQVRLENLLTAIISDPSSALGQSSCWPLGDLIIALQTPTDKKTMMWTTDSDLKSLCTVLDIPLYEPSSET